MLSSLPLNLNSSWLFPDIFLWLRRSCIRWLGVAWVENSWFSFSCLCGISVKDEKFGKQEQKGRALCRTSGKGKKYAGLLPRSLEENSFLTWNLLTKVTQSMSEIILKAISHGTSITKPPISTFRMSLSEQKLLPSCFLNWSLFSFFNLKVI